MRHILLNLLMLFGKEFVEIYFPLLIMIQYQRMVAEKNILMILLYHQMITFKGPLHMFFVYNTLMHDLGRTCIALGIIDQTPVTLGGKTVLVDIMVIEDPLDFNMLLGHDYVYAMQAMVSTFFV